MSVADFILLAGAFTPGCSVRHLPPYIENLSEIKSKGVDLVIVIAFNDAWVMSAWGKANSVKGDDLVGQIYFCDETLKSDTFICTALHVRHGHQILEGDRLD